MGTSKEVTKLCSKGPRFGDTLKIVEKYWEAKSGSVCLTYTGIGYGCLKEYVDKGV